MPSTKRQRELARRRAERQAARRAELRAKRRARRLTIAAVTASVLLIAGGAFALKAFVLDGDGDTTAGPSASPSASVAANTPACGAKAPPAPKKQTFPKEPALAIDKAKTYSAAVKTSCGTVVFDLFADKAPKTTNSFFFLAGKKYYDGTHCHRMTTANIFVLQCGDPTGTGSGGPGYTLAEENLKGAKYPRGTVAMAKSQAPHSTGSQFFLVYKDTQLPPQYTVAGRITEGLDVLDKIAKIGVDNANGEGDGAPLQRVYIEALAVRPK